MLVLDRINVPAPVLVRPPAPLPMTPLIVVLPAPVTVRRFAPLVTEPLTVSVPASLWMVPAPFKVIARFTPRL